MSVLDKIYQGLLDHMMYGRPRAEYAYLGKEEWYQLQKEVEEFHKIDTKDGEIVYVHGVVVYRVMADSHFNIS